MAMSRSWWEKMASTHLQQQFSLLLEDEKKYQAGRAGPPGGGVRGRSCWHTTPKTGSHPSPVASS